MKLLIAALMLGMTFMGVSCSDEYNYPAVLTEFVDIHTSAEGVIDELHTDAGDKYAVKFREGLGGLVADSIYRSVSVYQLLPKEEGDTAVKLYFNFKKKDKNVIKFSSVVYWILLTI